MAEGKEKLKQRALHFVFIYLVGCQRALEAKRIDIAARPLPWTFDEETRTWTYEKAPNRVTIAPVLENFFWQGCLEQRHRIKHNSTYFDKLEDALAWAEQEIQLAMEAAQLPEAQPAKPACLSLETLTAAHRRRLKRYWIEPSALEPTRPSYRVVIDILHAPTRSGSLELSFREQITWGEQYPKVHQIMPELAFNSGSMDIIELVDGWYRITSLTTFSDPATAEAYALRMWEASTITSGYRTKQITRAAYGIEEVETAYCVWKGWCGRSPAPPEERAAFLRAQAFKLTLAYALDLKGYRAMLAFDKSDMSDAAILRIMHKFRAMSSAIPDAARSESAQWLSEH